MTQNGFLSRKQYTNKYALIEKGFAIVGGMK